MLNEQLLASNGIDDHHIFPAKFLDDRGIDSRLRDCVLNRCLIDSHTNQRISLAPPPSIWRNFGMSRASRWKPCSPAT